MTKMARKLYAVGDVHGCSAALLAALDGIEADAGANGADVIFLGDYVDRGPDSRAVVETLIAGPRRPQDTWRCIMGNHEAMMLETIVGGIDKQWWHGNGGDKTILSYAGTVPTAHLDWLKSLPAKIETENYIFVHAGLRPGVPTDKQSDEEIMWIRGEFLHTDFDFGKHVVHGHTPKPDVERKKHRTNLDTAACYGGKLSVGVFDPSSASGPIAVLQFVEPRT